MRPHFTQLFLVTIAMASSACSGNSDGQPATKADCRAVQAHLASLRVQIVAKNSTLSEAELAKHQQNFAVSSDVNTEACAEKHSKGWATCMLALSSTSEMQSCDD